MQIEAEKQPTLLLQGYNPRKEIANWTILSSLVLSPLILSMLSCFPMFSARQLIPLIHFNRWWGIGVAIIAFGFLLCIVQIAILRPIFTYKHFKNLYLSYTRLLRKDAKIEYLTIDFPASKIVLPFSIQAKVKKLRLRTMISIWSIIFLVLLFFTLDTIFAFSFVTDYPLLGSMLVMPLFIIFPTHILQTLKSSIYDFFLQPSLTLMEDSITAHYGKQSIRMRWQDIRLFIVTTDNTRTINNIQLSDKEIAKKIAQKDKRFSSYAFLTQGERKIYELSDGQNTICWYAQLSKDLFYNYHANEELLSPKAYNTFMETLPAFIVQKSGCPLYDLQDPSTQLKLKKADSIIILSMAGS